MVAAVARPRVALIANTLAYFSTFRLQTIERLLAEGFGLVCVGDRHAGAEQILAARGVEVEALNWPTDGMNPLHEAGTVWRLRRLLRAARPVCAFSFTVKGNLATALAVRGLRIPYATNVSGLGTAFLHEGRRYRLIRRLYGWANQGAHTVFFQNHEDPEVFRGHGLSVGPRTAVLPGSGVDTARFALEPAPRRVRRFVMIGRLIGDKGVREYLEAARRLEGERPDLEFDLVGPTGVRNATAISLDEIESHAARVHYLGEVDDVRPAIREADCVVLPSYREGMPKVILEAASMGRIAIVTDVPGCREAIEPGITGFLCEPRSVESLVEALRMAADLSPERLADMSGNARRRAVERFAVEKAVVPYLAIAKSLS